MGRALALMARPTQHVQHATLIPLAILGSESTVATERHGEERRVTHSNQDQHRHRSLHPWCYRQAGL